MHKERKKVVENPTEKKELHPRNKHRNGYDFEALVHTLPELKNFVFTNKYQTQTIDFSDPLAVKALNKSLLKHFYQLNFWDIPSQYLCPPIPGRADYIHYLADLHSENNGGKIPQGNNVKVLDIGTGANLIYPILGLREHGWQFVATDVDSQALRSAEKIITENSLKENIQLRLQKSPQDIFKHILLPDDRFDLTMCNPPFHGSQEEAQAGTERKWKNLGKKTSALNFGGRQNELWYEGGERAFVYKMILQSADFPLQSKWYTTLISKSANLPAVYGALEKVKARSVKTIEMSQGNKISRIVAWSFI
ncbi:MAG TPA: 23S rRNA (adenine(1618)-N(6))-methyltransferase RlmF [Cytophagaceae bacterium]|jgi:23S rRNA (adenine1618-N6)-methyltransferase|nr:23S rRNA (adenine(1618)-N(6))-methyltransferase RlmF [Cytophagaceae bacterium]